jgi:hypothetical protein
MDDKPPAGYAKFVEMSDENLEAHDDARRARWQLASLARLGFFNHRARFS